MPNTPKPPVFVHCYSVENDKEEKKSFRIKIRFNQDTISSSVNSPSEVEQCPSTSVVDENDLQPNSIIESSIADSDQLPLTVEDNVLVEDNSISLATNSLLTGIEDDIVSSESIFESLQPHSSQVHPCVSSTSDAEKLIHTSDIPIPVDVFTPPDKNVSNDFSTSKKRKFSDINSDDWDVQHKNKQSDSKRNKFFRKTPLLKSKNLDTDDQEIPHIKLKISKSLQSNQYCSRLTTEDNINDEEIQEKVSENVEPSLHKSVDVVEPIFDLTHTLQQESFTNVAEPVIDSIPVKSPEVTTNLNEFEPVTLPNQIPISLPEPINLPELLPPTHLKLPEIKAKPKKTKKKKVLSYKSLLTELIKKLKSMDKCQIFHFPVQDSFAPNYSKIIKKPMDLSTMMKKVDYSKYRSLADFRDDIVLMCENAKKYNQTDTIYYKAAQSMLQYTNDELFSADSMAAYRVKYTSLTANQWSLFSSHTPILSDTRVINEELSFPLSSTTPNVLDSKPQESSANQLDFPVKDENVVLNDIGLLSFSDLESSINNLEPIVCRQTKRNEELFDGLTADQLIKSVQHSAKMAAKRREQGSRKTYISYLQENGTNNVSLNSLPDKRNESVNVRQVSMDWLYTPSETGRIELNVLNNLASSTSNSTSVTISLGLSNNSVNNNEFNCDISNQHDPNYASLNNEMNSDQTHDDNSYLKDTVERNKRIRELRKQLLPIYGDQELGIDYSLSISKYGQNSEYTKNLVNSLLGVLTGGKHRTVLKKFYNLLDENNEI